MIAAVFTLLVCSSSPSALSPGRLSVEPSQPLALLLTLPRAPNAGRLAQADETRTAAEPAPHKPRRYILTGIAVGLALFGAYAYLDTRYHPGRSPSDDGLAEGLGYLAAIELGLGALICGGLGAYFWSTDP